MAKPATSLRSVDRATATHHCILGPMARLALILGALVCAAAGCDGLRSLPEAVTVQIGGELFTMDVSADDPSRIRGLQGVTEIPSDGGMIFVFPDSQVRSFWMPDCLVDIDLMFLDSQGRVTAVHTMPAEPPRRADEPRPAYERRLPRYPSGYPAQFAIELRAGTLDRLGLEVNSRIDLNLPRLKALAR